MILKELRLISFGKFQNKIIHLEEGLNIIYGENESGKTTIHNFIDGMFYGFLKPYAKIRNYSEELEKYRPWNGQDYSGIVKLFQSGKDYRIERNFDKKQVKVYDDLTGIDISSEIDMGEKLKDHLPGLYFFDFNNMVYNNTISIKQLENKVDGDLSKEVKDRLANISTSLDEDISVKNAISELDRQLNDIGTKRAPTKPYGKAIIDLDNLENQRKKLLQKREEHNEQIKHSLDLKEKIKIEEKKLKELNNKLKQLEILEKKKAYEEAVDIKAKLEEIDLEIVNLKKYANLSFEDYALALKLEKDLEYINKEIEEIKENSKILENRLKTLEMETEENTIDGFNMEELFTDLNTLDEMNEEKNHIILNREKNKLDILNSELRNRKDKKRSVKITIIISILLAFASMGLGFINKFFLFLPPIFGITAIIFRNSHKNYLSEIKSLKEEIEDLTEREKAKDARLIYIENYQKEILLKNNCSSKLELKKLRDDIYYKYKNSQNREEEIKKINKELEKNTLTLEMKQNNIYNFKSELDIIFKNNNSNNIEGYKTGLDKKRKYEELIQERKNKIQLLEKILGDNSLESIKTEIKDYNVKTLIDMDKNQLLWEIEDRKESFQSNLDLNSRLEERIDNLNKDIRTIIEIEEEIERLKTAIENYENQIKSINIAKEIIQNISKDLHQQFAPSINKDVSEIIYAVSDGKYNEVKIDEELNISVENSNTKEIISIDSLSGGTIDQLYFALRFSIISSMRGEALPLVLDDCFIQYDDERLENILKYLVNVSLDKQIILFTCHNREREILEELNLKHNLIKL